MRRVVTRRISENQLNADLVVNPRVSRDTYAVAPVVLSRHSITAIANLRSAVLSVVAIAVRVAVTRLIAATSAPIVA